MERRRASNRRQLSANELLVTIGQAFGRGRAWRASERAVSFADRSGDFVQAHGRARTAHADALFQAGALARAEVLFREAEALQRGRPRPDLPRSIRYRLLHIATCCSPAPPPSGDRQCLHCRAATAMDLALQPDVAPRQRLNASPRGAGGRPRCCPRREECCSSSRRRPRRPARANGGRTAPGLSPMPKRSGAAAMRTPPPNR